MTRQTDIVVEAALWAAQSTVIVVGIAVVAVPFLSYRILHALVSVVADQFFDWSGEAIDGANW